MEGADRKLALITIYHTGAYSAVKAFRDAGKSVVPDGGIGMLGKIAQLEADRDADVIWAHWSWIEQCKWILDRHVVTVLRDPVEIAISSYVREQQHKAVRQAEQWMQLYRYRHLVDHWVDFEGLDFSRYGLGPLPHENATPADHPLKRLYTDGVWGNVRKALGTQWDCLMVIRREIEELFEIAGLSQRLAKPPFFDSSVVIDYPEF